MRLCVSSDWHADWSTLGVRRHDEVRDAAVQVAEACVREKVDAFLFLGDLADPDTGGDTFASVALAITIALRLDARKVQSVWLAGNHDVCEDGTGCSTLTPLKAIESYAPHVRVVTRPGLVWLRSPDVALVALPFVPLSHGVDMASAARDLWPRDLGPSSPAPKVVVAGHLMLPGIHPGSETTDMPRGREVLFPFEETRGAALRLNGHYHRRQKYDPGDGGPEVVIPGALARLTFGEEDHDPAFLLIDV